MKFDFIISLIKINTTYYAGYCLKRHLERVCWMSGLWLPNQDLMTWKMDLYIRVMLPFLKLPFLLTTFLKNRWPSGFKYNNILRNTTVQIQTYTAYTFNSTVCFFRHTSAVALKMVMLVCHSVHHFGVDLSISAAVGWIVIQFGADIQVDHEK